MRFCHCVSHVVGFVLVRYSIFALAKQQQLVDGLALQGSAVCCSALFRLLRGNLYKRSFCRQSHRACHVFTRRIKDTVEVEEAAQVSATTSPLRSTFSHRFGHLTIPGAVLEEEAAEEVLPAAGLVTASADYYPTVAINALMRTLRDPVMAPHHAEVVRALFYIFKVN